MEFILQTGNAQQSVSIKQQILSKFSQEEIFQKYLGFYPKLNVRYTNPLRENKTPNTEFLYVGDVLYMRDWGSDQKNLNCFSLVQHLYNCSFYEALQHVQIDFGMDAKQMQQCPPTIQRNSNYAHVEAHVNKLQTIRIRKKEFTEKELEFWNCNGSFNFNTKKLESMQIYSTEYVWYNNNQWKSAEGVFAYQLKQGIFQIYSPFNEDRRYRFRSTNLKDVIAGVQWLEKSEYVVLSKSYKDMIMLRSLNVNACALLNEGIIPTKEQMSLIASYGTPVVLFDSDEKGIAVSKKICELYGCRYLQLPDGNFKDAYEFVYEEGKSVVEEWLDENGLLI
jgi:hypothetical protein